MGRFAHIADVHLGYQKNPLRRIEQRVFGEIVSYCISERIDFVLVCGDLFHVNIPDMETCKFAFEQFRLLHEAGIPVYAVYGSHDTSPRSASIIDLLEVSGFITKSTRLKESDGVDLELITDPKTGVRIAGLPGLKAGRDSELYDSLRVEDGEGFKIFMFHGAISELMADAQVESMPLSRLPPGFGYYAGGHVHEYDHQSFEGYPHVVYPGTPFCGYGRDLENNARGTRRGFAVVRFDEGDASVDFREIKGAEYDLIDISCKGRSADSVNAELQRRAEEIDPREKIIVIKIAGDLATGKTADVDTVAARNRLKEAGALDVVVHKNQMTSREYSITRVAGASREEISQNVFSENIGEVRSGRPELEGESGVSVAKSLLDVLAKQQLEGEVKREYESRVVDEGLHSMGIGDDS